MIKSWLDPGTPVNGGTFRPLEFLVPEGSCLAAQLPAPVGGCWEVYRQLQSSVVGLIFQVIPGAAGRGDNRVGQPHLHSRIRPAQGQVLHPVRVSEGGNAGDD